MNLIGGSARVVSPQRRNIHGAYYLSERFALQRVRLGPPRPLKSQSASKCSLQKIRHSQAFPLTVMTTKQTLVHAPFPRHPGRPQNFLSCASFVHRSEAVSYVAINCFAPALRFAHMGEAHTGAIVPF